MTVHYQCLSFAELSKDQLYELLALRQEVFVVEQHCPYLDADGQDQIALHVLGYTDNEHLATYTRLLPKGVSYQKYAAIGRVITAAFARGKKLGRPLIQISLQKLWEHWGQVPVKLSAQAHLQSYYRSVGFAPVGDVYMEDGIPHIGMVYRNEEP
ncbi:MAG: GNAT family N-acetyltransferase [Bacteroidota bacterium]